MDSVLWGLVIAEAVVIAGFIIYVIRLKQMMEQVSEEEIMSMVNEGHEQGLLEENEAQMITNIFEFGDKEAQDIMTHRQKIVAFDAEISLSEAVRKICTETNSRFPVYEEGLDNIIGILHLKEALAAFERSENRGKALKGIPGLLRQPYLIPGTKKIDDLFYAMQQKKIHMAIVVDEYGQTDGLLTQEDILEEIVGNIMDEYDQEEEMIVTLKDGSLLVNGLASLEEVNEKLGMNLSEEELDSFDTLNGFVVDKLTYIPEKGDHPSLEWGDYRFDIQNANGKMIQKIRITEKEKGEKVTNERT